MNYTKQKIAVRVEVFREGSVYTALCPDLDLSSFGETAEDAKNSFREALEAFVEECEAMGTLEEVLEEAGFVRNESGWLPRQPISAELVTVG
ncbi:MAG: type II toxin-antitoxin system HicB family antitoxin [bacterium]